VAQNLIMKLHVSQAKGSLRTTATDSAAVMTNATSYHLNKTFLVSNYLGYEGVKF